MVKNTHGKQAAIFMRVILVGIYIYEGLGVSVLAQDPWTSTGALDNNVRQDVTGRGRLSSLAVEDRASGNPMVRLNPTNAESGRWAIDPDGIEVGGAYLPDIPNQGAAPGTRGALGSVRISCHPYGNYDAGSCLTIENTAFGREGSRAGIGAALEQSTSALANYQSFENVMITLGSSAPPSRAILKNVSYDETHVYAPGCGPSNTSTDNCRPWPSSTMAIFRRGMTITTNSIDPMNHSFTPPGSLRVLPQNWGLYASFIDQWDSKGRWISIRPGWVVPGSGNGRTGQVPSTHRLDKVLTYYSDPVVFLGGEEKDFGMVSQLAYNPQLDSSGHPTTIVARQFEREEVDLIDYGQVDYGASWHGFTISHSSNNNLMVPELDGNCHSKRDVTGAMSQTMRWVSRDPNTYKMSVDHCGQPNGHPVLPTADSYGLFIAGGFGEGGGTLLRLTANAGEQEISSTSLNTYGAGSPDASAGATWELGEWDGEADTNKLRFVNWIRRTSQGHRGWQNAEYDMGLWVDGTAQRLADQSKLSGSPMAHLSFNHGSNLGGLDVISDSGTDMISLHGSGDVAVSRNLSTGGGIVVGGVVVNAAYRFQTLPHNIPPGSQAYCEDCVIGNGSRGILVLFNGNRWTGVSGEALSH